MDHVSNYSIGKAISETAQALASTLEIPQDVTERILKPWVKRAPLQEQPDVLQDVAVRVLRFRPKTPGLLYAVIRGCVLDWWKAYKLRQHSSLDVQVARQDDGGEPITVGETLSSRMIPVDEFVCNFVIAEGILGKIPASIKEVGLKREVGLPLGGDERQRLSRWRRNNLSSFDWDLGALN